MMNDSVFLTYERVPIQKSYCIDGTYLTVDFHRYNPCETGYSWAVETPSPTL